MKMAENKTIKEVLGNPFSVRPLYDKWMKSTYSTISQFK
jgi:hypothetical protein